MINEVNDSEFVDHLLGDIFSMAVPQSADALGQLQLLSVARFDQYSHDLRIESEDRQTRGRSILREREEDRAGREL